MKGDTYRSFNFGVGNIATVDGAPDNGFLNCAACSLPGSKRHLSTQQAIDNLLSQLPMAVEQLAGSGNPWIVGHGNEGLIVTGQGQTPSDPQKFVTTWNQYAWQPELARLAPRPFPILTLLSCHTGAGESGADLLFAIAKVINRAVQARTGFSYCGGCKISYEANSTWQVATPQARPTPIPPPTQHFTTNLEQMTFHGEGKTMLTLNTAKPVLVQLFTARLETEKAGFIPGERILEVGGDAALGLLKLVDFNNPFQPGGVPAAIVTGILETKGVDMSGRNFSRAFLLYNNRLLQDRQSPDTFYHVASSFPEALKFYRR